MINEKIRVKEVRLIDGEGGQVGVVSIETARQMGLQSGLDLILISETAVPPVCKLVDFGQFKYQQQKKDKQNRKNTKSQVTKEIKLSAKISDHDYVVKLNKGKEFLAKGFKVKLSMMFRGREIMHVDLGRIVIDRFFSDIAGIGIGSDVVQTGKSLVAIVHPK